ncbi:hypothetical protein KFU94_19490 [Chloroflexi bacterium TSY]|nr:hypothetical protein [Chloroflexi bacterium TSY]
MAGEIGRTGDDLLAEAQLDVNQLAADPATRESLYRGKPVEELPNLDQTIRSRIQTKLIEELSKAKPKK